MSGGSYNYLYCHVAGLEAQRSDLEAMRDRLAELEREQVPGASKAARLTRYVLIHLDLAEAKAQELADVWHAIEWRDSGDYGDSQVEEALAKFGVPSG
ncbi:hypothetical protein OG571_47195 (plasmid) [Streptomyces sp. NBC_01369]|uniref:hypothetical protein n=1 Tax=Streptomyces sp. NBC_01369 TaxID=2903842 RepID=UPI002F91869F